jgi:hypothetical protein
MNQKTNKRSLDLRLMSLGLRLMSLSLRLFSVVSFFASRSIEPCPFHLMRPVPADILTHLLSLRPKTVGNIFTSGSGECGQLGAGCDILERNKLGKVELDDIVQVQGGGMHCLALSNQVNTELEGHRDPQRRKDMEDRYQLPDQLHT